MISIFWVKFSFPGPITFANLIALALESQKKGVIVWLRRALMDAEGCNGKQRACWEGGQMVDVDVDML